VAQGQVAEVRELRGVLTALVTPLDAKGRVDEAGVRRLVEHVLAGGVHGLVPLGSTGETASLDETGRRRMLAACVSAAGGRVPIICGVAQPNLTGAVAEVKAAAELGADAVLAAPPFYYPIDQPTVLDFYRRLAAESPLRILVYNIPQFTKVVIEPPTLARLAEEGVVVGIKDSSRDYEYFERVCVATRGLPGFRVFTGSDWMLLGSLVMGAAGTICGAANVAPGWVVRVFDDFQAGRWDAARVHQDALVELMIALRVGVFPAAIKASLDLQGVCGPWTVAPVPPLSSAIGAALGERLLAMGLLPPVVAARK
jgi:dihydrodipicolinate synthase/N-acetylneuraminate lyase